MILNLNITEKKAKPFAGNDGKEMDYFWYKGEKKDGLTISFGSIDGSHEIGDNVDVDLEKTEKSNGGFVYKERVKPGEKGN